MAGLKGEGGAEGRTCHRWLVSLELGQDRKALRQ